VPPDPSPAIPGQATRCAILAGGEGSRIGGVKALIELAGRPLIEHAIAAAEVAELRPLVIAKASSDLGTCGAEILHEPIRPLHPLLGIAVALEALGEPIVVSPCDCPLLPPGLLATLAGRPEPNVVVAGDAGVEPQIGRYSPAAAPALRGAAVDGRAAGAAVRDLGPVLLSGGELAAHGDPRRFLLNVNTPADLAAAEAQVSAAGG
jgi:molybdopterin-guanine dinucleotide biosynthesis protein A